MSSPVVLILGAGPNVGTHLARAFAAKGYRLALASRNAKEEENTADQINVKVDLSTPDSVVEVFSEVEKSLGLPSVVVYNASAGSLNDPKHPLAPSVADFARDLTINTTSVFAAAQTAVAAFEQLPASASKTFIFTGNALNTMTLPRFMVGGVGKSATSHMIQNAAAAYADRGIKFYYADERKADGTPVYSDISGEAHADLYPGLAEGKSQGPWQQTFVKGLGYKQF